MNRVFLVEMVIVLLIGCINPLVGPDGVEVETNIRSTLGFYIQAHREFVNAGGVVTQLHADLADKWWDELMNDLQTVGFGGADPNNTFGYVKIVLRQPQGPHEYIYCSRLSGLQGACYSPGYKIMEVPGNYPTTAIIERPASQPLKHEMLHHFCYRKLGYDCLTDNAHFYPSLNDPKKDIWDFTWE